MKKLLCLSCAAFLSLGLFACSDSNDTEEPHVCGHFKGNYQSEAKVVNAGVSGETAVLLTDRHSVYNVKLTAAAQGMFEGYVSIAATEIGELHLYTTQKTSDLLSFFKYDKITSLPIDDITSCQIFQYTVYVEEIGTVVVKVKASTPSLFLLVENVEHEHQ